MIETVSSYSLRGIFPPLVTPLAGDATHPRLDVDGLERLVEHVLAGGVAGVFVLGTTGETASLTGELRTSLARETCRVLDGRRPTLVGITNTSLAESLALAEVAAAAGAAYVVAAPPYYYPITQAELIDYYERLLDASPLPLLLYNIPSCTRTALDVATVTRLADHPGVIGIKDSSRDFDYFAQLAASLGGRDDFALLVGPEILLARAIEVGAVGGICGGANVFPSLYVELHQAATDGNRQRVAELHAVVEQIGATIYRAGSGGAPLIQGLKAALLHLGICAETMLPPLAPLDHAARDQVAGYVAQLQVALER